MQDVGVPVVDAPVFGGGAGDVETAGCDPVEGGSRVLVTDELHAASNAALDIANINIEYILIRIDRIATSNDR